MSRGGSPAFCSERPRKSFAADALVRVAGLFSLFAFAWILHVLSQDGSPSRSGAFFYLSSEEAPEQIQRREANRVIVPLISDATPIGFSRHSLWLHFEEASPLLTSARISLMLQARDPVFIVSARLLHAEGSHEITRSQRLEGARLVEFLKSGKSDAGGKISSDDLLLEVVTESPARLSLHAQRSDPDDSVAGLVHVLVEEPGQAARSGAVVGRFELPAVDHVFSYAELLSCTWGFGPSGSRTVYGIILAATLLWLCGLFLVRCGSALALTGGIGMLSLSICWVYAVLSPPFQGPDEPDHVLSFARTTGNESLAADALPLANISHFERIKFRSEEKFSSLDVGNPWTDSWAPHIYAYSADKTPLGRIIWQALDGMMDRLSPGSAILVLRLSNGLYVALCLFLSLFLAAVVLHRDASLMFLAFPALLVPSIAYFGVMVSNYAYLVGAYLVQAVALGVLWQGLVTRSVAGRFFVVAGALAGVGASLAAAAADNGFISLVFWGLVIPLYAAISVRESGWRRSQLLLVAFIAALSGCCMLVASFGPDGLGMAPRVFEFLQRQQVLPKGDPVGSLVLFVAAYGAAVGLMAAALATIARSRHIAALAPYARVLFLVGTLLGALFVLVVAAPVVPDVQDAPLRPSLLKYIVLVLHAFVDGFGPGRADWYIVNHFWGSFGWLDTVLPEWLRVFLRLATGAGLLLFLTGVLLSRSPRGSLAFASVSLAAIIAMLLTIVILYYSYYSITVNVHGRYLIGLYVFVIVLAAEGYRRALARSGNSLFAQSSFVAGICLLSAGIHAVCWTTILNRYLQ